MSSDPSPQREAPRRTPPKPWGLEGAGPWTPRAGSPIFGDEDPRDRPDTAPFFAYSVASDELSITIYSDLPSEEAAVYVAEEPEAIHAVLVGRTAPLPVNHQHGAAYDEHRPTETLVRFERPLAGRLVVDALRDRPAVRLASRPASSELDGLRAASLALAAAGAVEILAWSAATDDCSITVYWSQQWGESSVRATESADEVQLLLTDPPTPVVDGEHHGFALIGEPAHATVSLREPLGDRMVIDELTGRPPRRVGAPPDRDPRSPNFIGLTAEDRVHFRRNGSSRS